MTLYGPFVAGDRIGVASFTRHSPFAPPFPPLLFFQWYYKLLLVSDGSRVRRRAETILARSSD